MENPIGVSQVELKPKKKDTRTSLLFELLNNPDKIIDVDGLANVYLDGKMLTLVPVSCWNCMKISFLKESSTITCDHESCNKKLPNDGKCVLCEESLVDTCDDNCGRGYCREGHGPPSSWVDVECKSCNEVDDECKSCNEDGDVEC